MLRRTSLTLKSITRWKVGHQEDVRRDACNVGDETDFAPIVQPDNEKMDFLTEPFELDRSRSPRFPRVFNPTLCRNLLWRETLLYWNPTCFWFLAERDDDAFDD